MSPTARMVLLASLLPACAVGKAPPTPPTPVSSAVTLSLGTAGSFAVLAGSTVTNIGPTVVSGDLGVSPGTSVTGFPPGNVIDGTIHTADALALEAENAATAAYGILAGEACDFSFTVPTDLGGMTLVPGVYCFSSSVGLTGAVTLDAGNDPAAVFVIKAVSTLITASGSSVALVNGAQPCNVSWQVGSSATLGTGTTFMGTIFALTSISLQTGASLSGRALAQTGGVTLDSNEITAAVCGAQPATAPGLAKSFLPSSIPAGDLSTLTITLSNVDSAPTSLTAPLTDALPAGMVVSGGATTDCGGTVGTTLSSVTLTGGSIPADGSCTVVVSVTASVSGAFLNNLAVGALQTGNGSNAAAAQATLTVLPCMAPTLSKSFTPSTIPMGGVSTLVITLSNPDNSAAAALTAELSDDFPAGLLASGDASTTCGGLVTTGLSGTEVDLTGGSIPADGSCTVTVNVTAAVAGSYCNTIPAGALQTSTGINGAPATATLTVGACTDDYRAPLAYSGITGARR